MIQLLARLPGLGPRSARRAALYLIQRRESLLQPLAEALERAGERIVACGTCGNLDVEDPCEICREPGRDQSMICVVEEVGDLWALERSAAFKGLGARRARPGKPQPRQAGRARGAGGRGRGDPGAQRHGRWPDHRSLYRGAAGALWRVGDAPGAWRAGRRRARLPRRRHPDGGAQGAAADGKLSRRRFRLAGAALQPLCCRIFPARKARFERKNSRTPG